MELQVQVQVWGKLVQTLDRDDGEDDNEHYVDVDSSSKEWGDDHPMWCETCGYDGKAGDFDWQSGPKGTLPVIAEKPE